MSVRPPREPLSNGTDILEASTQGNYVLGEQIASGELATLHVAQALDATGSAGELLIKQLQPAHRADPERRSALVRETSVSTRLGSPHLLRVVTFEESQSRGPYLVLERIAGPNLHALLRQAGNDVDTMRVVLPIFVDALLGLHELHRAGESFGGPFLVHQAPCARHILASVDGRARIVDLTLVTGPTLPRSPLCDDRLRPAEMAPEQVLAPSDIDPRCDIFIAGTTLWEALTGRRLFFGETPQASLEKMLRSTIPTPSEAGARTSRALDRVCMRALQRSRHARYPSATEMAAELREAAERAELFAESAEVALWLHSFVARKSAPGDRERRSSPHGTILGLGEPMAPSAPTAAPARILTDRPATSALRGSAAERHARRSAALELASVPSLAPRMSEPPHAMLRSRSSSSLKVAESLTAISMLDRSATPRAKRRRPVVRGVVFVLTLVLAGLAAHASRGPSLLRRNIPDSSTSVQRAPLTPAASLANRGRGEGTRMDSPIAPNAKQTLSAENSAASIAKVPDSANSLPSEGQPAAGPASGAALGVASSDQRHLVTGSGSNAGKSRRGGRRASAEPSVVMLTHASESPSPSASEAERPPRATLDLAAPKEETEASQPHAVELTPQGALPINPY